MGSFPETYNDPNASQKEIAFSVELTISASLCGYIELLRYNNCLVRVAL